MMLGVTRRTRPLIILMIANYIANHMSDVRDGLLDIDRHPKEW